MFDFGMNTINPQMYFNAMPLNGNTNNMNDIQQQMLNLERVTRKEGNDYHHTFSRLIKRTVNIQLDFEINKFKITKMQAYSH